MADLTTTDTVRAYLGLESVEDDELLSRLITAASQFIETATGRVFAETAITEVQNGARHGEARRHIVPRQWPVISVASVKLNGVTLAASDYALVDEMIYLTGQNVPVGIGNVEIAYTAGYATVPADVEQAVVELVAYRYKAKDRISIANRSLPAGEALSFVGYQQSTQSVDAVIEQYRRLGAS